MIIDMDLQSFFIYSRFSFQRFQTPTDDCQRRQNRMQIQNAGYHGHISLIGAALPC